MTCRKVGVKKKSTVCSYLKYEAGDVYDHAGRDPVKRDAGSEQARSSVHRLNHCKGGGECTERV